MHIDKYRSNITGKTKVGFLKDGVLIDIRYYDHLNNEWNKRIMEENEWCKQSRCTCKFLNN